MQEPEFEPGYFHLFTLKDEILQMIILQPSLRKFELRPIKLQCQARTTELTS
jgi:hypothetical protein